MARAVELKHVSHVYVSDREASLAVENIQLSLKCGEFASLIGPSGCGKTTVLSMIAGLIRPTAGDIFVGEKPVQGPDRQIGYMLQQDYLFPWKSIHENALIGLKLLGIRDREHLEYVDQLLDEVGLLKAKNLYPHQLSGGMRQRVAFVRTLATKPDILLLDEPFSALDYYTKLQLEDLVAEILHSHKLSAMLVTHDITEAIAMSDSVYIMKKNPGRIAREVRIPESIRTALPFQARKLPGFHDLFEDLWKWFDPKEMNGT